LIKRNLFERFLFAASRTNVHTGTDEDGLPPVAILNSKSCV